MKRQFSAGIIAYHRKNKIVSYLLLHYPRGYWDFPKGKIEENENKQQAAIRELKEETGLEAQIVPDFEDHVEYFFRAERELFFKTVSFFLGEVKTMEVLISHEHQGYDWLEYERAYERLTYQNAKNLLKRAHQFLIDLGLTH